MTKVSEQGETAQAVDEIEPVPIDVVVPPGFWQREAEHAPQPVKPMDASVFFDAGAPEAACRRWMDEFGLLMETIEFGVIGGWHYVHMVPLGGKDGPTPPAWLMPLLVRAVPSIRRRLKACV